jgi:hypothetical protein
VQKTSAAGARSYNLEKKVFNALEICPDARHNRLDEPSRRHNAEKGSPNTVVRCPDMAPGALKSAEEQVP